ncbi:PAS domain-containing protein [Pseudooceanicola sp. CBS1P-1]|uniref:PAS domain-containing protein n=2 Tax=Paracoccaceae TaxID=31989 RepID=A0A6L7G4T9_9RHOB|nr:PAS domain-containing protein [Pseudooceanicola endophyticus]MXN17643.1 PAS domain-containing protein [Pseudooceanicola albus]
MSSFVSAARFGAISEVEAYWEAIRAGRLVPRRSDIDPRGIERALEYAFILERVAPGIARMRIAGSHLSDLMGMEVRGMPLSAFMTATSRNLLGEILEEVFDSPAKAVVELESERAIGKPHIEARMIMLPMKSDLGDITRMLGCFVTTGEIGRTPRRFEITDSHVTPLLGDFLKPAEPRPEPEARPAPAPEEPRTPFVAPVPSTLRPADDGIRLRPGPRPYLQVVDTGAE